MGEGSFHLFGWRLTAVRMTAEKGSPELKAKRQSLKLKEPSLKPEAQSLSS
jgi:hypothetical protein